MGDAGPDPEPITPPRAPASRFVAARLVNGLFGDPALFLDFRLARRALLFDLGDVSALGARELLRVSHVFVSHTHLDHFAGFDRLLRLRLDRDRPLHLVGPEGFIDRVAAKLGAYTWNLLDETVPDFVVTACEFVGERLTRQSRFAARQRFRRCDGPPPASAPGLVLEEAAFSVQATTLDHGTPCLAFGFVEQNRVRVVKPALDRLDLPVGPWIARAKQAIRAGLGDDATIEVAGRDVALGLLRAGALVTVPGQRIAYAVDIADTPDNQARLLALAREADQLFIETAFANEDGALAQARRHLTAGAAGGIARAAGVKAASALHVSARYADRPDHVLGQFEAAFRGEAAPP